MHSHHLVERLIDWVEAGWLIAVASLSHTDIDMLLDGRDSDEFDTRWLTVYRLLEGVSSLSNMDTNFVQRLSNAAYKSVFETSQHPDFSSYVSDDFELIGKSLITDTQISWLNGLWRSYKRGQFPTGTIDEVPGRLGDLI